MFKYIFKRILFMIPVLLAITIIVFSLSEFASGDAARTMAERKYSHPTKAQIEEVRHEYGLDRPLHKKYEAWLSKVLRGDFGNSYLTGRPAIQELTGCFSETLKLTGVSFFLLVIITIPLGIFSAVKRGTILDKIIGLFSFVSVSMPSFWIGLILLYVLGVKLNLISVIGGEGIGVILAAAFTMDIGYFGVITELVRTNLSNVLAQDYVRAMKSRGISNIKIVMKHGLKNIFIPILTQFSFILINLFCGSAIIESVFSIRGIGELALVSVQCHDMPVLQCFILCLAIFVVMVNLIVDIIYSCVDKRIRLS